MCIEDDEHSLIIQLAKVASIVPVTNAWPERGASAVKRIKSRTRSLMKNDLLNAFMHISINGPPLHTKEADAFISRVAEQYALGRHRKVAEQYALGRHRKVAEQYALGRHRKAPELFSERSDSTSAST